MGLKTRCLSTPYLAGIHFISLHQDMSNFNLHRITQLFNFIQDQIELLGNVLFLETHSVTTTKLLSTIKRPKKGAFKTLSAAC